MNIIRGQVPAQERKFLSLEIFKEFQFHLTVIEQ